MNTYTAILIDPISKIVSPIEFDGTWVQARTIMGARTIETYRSTRDIRSQEYANTCIILDENGSFQQKHNAFYLRGRKLYGKVIIAGPTPSADDHARAADMLATNPIRAIPLIRKAAASQHNFAPLDSDALNRVLAALSSDLIGFKVDYSQPSASANQQPLLVGDYFSKPESKISARLAKGNAPASPIPQGLFLKFVQEFKAGRVANVVGQRLAYNGDLRIPSYDFGSILDQHAPDYVGDFQPTFSTTSEQDGQPPRAYIAHFQSAPTPFSIIVIGSATYVKGNGGEICDYYFFEKGRFSKVFGEDMRLAISVMDRAEYLLQNREIDYVDSDTDRVASINRYRIAKGKTITPTPKVIHLRETRYRNANDNHPGSGIERVPHERKGHDRKLGGGRVIKVKSSIIHADRYQPATKTASEMQHVVKAPANNNVPTGPSSMSGEA
jgi:hypothetical protein